MHCREPSYMYGGGYGDLANFKKGRFSQKKTRSVDRISQCASFLCLNGRFRSSFFHASLPKTVKTCSVFEPQRNFYCPPGAFSNLKRSFIARPERFRLSKVLCRSAMRCLPSFWLARTARIFAALRQKTQKLAVFAHFLRSKVLSMLVHACFRPSKVFPKPHSACFPPSKAFPSLSRRVFGIWEHSQEFPCVFSAFGRIPTALPAYFRLSGELPKPHLVHFQSSGAFPLLSSQRIALLTSQIKDLLTEFCRSALPCD